MLRYPFAYGHQKMINDVGTIVRKIEVKGL